MWVKGKVIFLQDEIAFYWRLFDNTSVFIIWNIRLCTFPQSILSLLPLLLSNDFNLSLEAFQDNVNHYQFSKILL